MLYLDREEGTGIFVNGRDGVWIKDSPILGTKEHTCYLIFRPKKERGACG